MAVWRERWSTDKSTSEWSVDTVMNTTQTHLSRECGCERDSVGTQN